VTLLAPQIATPPDVVVRELLHRLESPTGDLRKALIRRFREGLQDQEDDERECLDCSAARIRASGRRVTPVCRYHEEERYLLAFGPSGHTSS
jgi:hypothetical protein